MDNSIRLVDAVHAIVHWICKLTLTVVGSFALYWVGKYLEMSVHVSRALLASAGVQGP
jgi:hypothetical protein